MDYTVNHAYTSRRDGLQLGPWRPGDVVALEAADAEWVNRDSPGCLLPTDAVQRQKPAGRDRQHRGGANRDG
jgi:hypothetical protein